MEILMWCNTCKKRTLHKAKLPDDDDTIVRFVCDECKDQDSYISEFTVSNKYADKFKNKWKETLKNLKI